MRGEQPQGTALVTGGAQGIGKAICARLLAAGYEVVIVDRDEEAGHETVAELQESGVLHFLPLDIAEPAQIEAAVAHTLALGTPLTALVNNAAISRRKPLSELSLEEWEAVLRINLTAPFLLARACADALRRQKGAILNIASTRAYMSEPHMEAYGSSKGGVIALTHALAASLAPHVRVNCIAPGWIETGRHRKSSCRYTPHNTEADRLEHFTGRVGVPEDVAALAHFLLSREEAGFISGQTFVVDGGMTRKMIYADT